MIIIAISDLLYSGGIMVDYLEIFWFRHRYSGKLST